MDIVTVRSQKAFKINKLNVVNTFLGLAVRLQLYVTCTSLFST